jgi:hypothetical protein
MAFYTPSFSSLFMKMYEGLKYVTLMASLAMPVSGQVANDALAKGLYSYGDQQQGYRTIDEALQQLSIEATSVTSRTPIENIDFTDVRMRIQLKPKKGGLDTLVIDRCTPQPLGTIGRFVKKAGEIISLRF